MPELLNLEYVGNGAYRPGLPARNMDRADIEDLARRQSRGVDEVEQEAVGSGLYVATHAEPEAPAGLDYGDMKKADLVALAESRGLAKGGTVAELVARLEADDEEQAAKGTAEVEAAMAASETAEGEESTAVEPGDDPDATEGTV